MPGLPGFLIKTGGFFRTQGTVDAEVRRLVHVLPPKDLVPDEFAEGALVTSLLDSMFDPSKGQQSAELLNFVGQVHDLVNSVAGVTIPWPHEAEVGKRGGQHQVVGIASEENLKEIERDSVYLQHNWDETMACSQLLTQVFDAAHKLVRDIDPEDLNVRLMEQANSDGIECPSPDPEEDGIANLGAGGYSFFFQRLLLF